MTLIAVHADTKRAQIMTDSWGYTFTLTMSTTSKQTVLPDLGMALAVQGSTTFQAEWLARAHVLAGRVANFDAFLDAAPDELRDGWAALAEHVEGINSRTGGTSTPAKSTIFHVGYSDRAGRFVAWVYASEQNFTPIDITDRPYVMPTPLNAAPGPVEAPRLVRHFERNGFPDDDLESLQHMAPLPAPRSKSEWIQLAKQVRRDRAECDIMTGFKTLVGGDVHLTTLEPGRSRTEVIHTYADDNESLARVFAGSLHPMSQHAACAGCDSGRPFVECCLGETHNGRLCPCDSGANFEDCCSVYSATSRDLTAATSGAPR